MDKTVIIGCGFLGSKIFTNLKNNNKKVIGTNFQNTSNEFKKLDITNFDFVNSFLNKEKPDLVINCAANTDIDYLEKNEKFANMVNGIGVKNIAKTCKQISSKLIHISTDSVFDGTLGLYTEEDDVKPINVYGKSKLLGEELLQENLDDFIIIRTNLFGYHHQGKFLFNWILRNLKENKEFTGFEDIIFNPLEISFLSDLILKFGNMEYSGIIHLGSDEIINKYNFGCEIADTFGFNKKLIKKGSIEHSSLIAKRPKNTSLSNLKAKKILKMNFPSLKEQILKIREEIKINYNDKQSH
ncbi:SDR family oxidoreductase [Nitrosopumilus sp. b3]|uniref:SDR family oxidoreductase n=1 Tax=Nitrosopumilus sp. b3 TaxID=2109909 RepID=UPI0015F45C18|nr:SDR family oxidoreductase [Nitrosopumilus sp. b3]